MSRGTTMSLDTVCDTIPGGHSFETMVEYKTDLKILTNTHVELR